MSIEPTKESSTTYFYDGVGLVPVADDKRVYTSQEAKEELFISCVTLVSLLLFCGLLYLPVWIMRISGVAHLAAPTIISDLLRFLICFPAALSIGAFVSCIRGLIIWSSSR